MERLAKVFGKWGPWLILAVGWLLKTWELWRYLGSRHYALWGLYFDTVHMDWMSWWTTVAINRPDQDLLYSTLVSYPVGCSTVLDSSLAFVHVILAGVLRLAVGSPASHNIVASLGVAVTLLGVFLLLRHISRNGIVAALLSLLVLTYGMAWARTLPDLELIFFGYLAFGLLAWYRYAESGGKWRLALAVGVLGWTSFSQMYYGFSLFVILGSAGVLAALGLTLRGVPPKVLLKRTALVVGIGLAIAVAFHLRNIINVLSVPQLPSNENRIFYELWQGALFVGSLLFLLAVGLLGAVPSAVFWGLVIVPLAALALGDMLQSPTLEINMEMPLRYLRQVRPFFWRLTFGFRFLAPVMLGMAAMVAAFWRDRTRLFASWPRLGSAAVGAILVGGFWLVAAFAPPVPRFERIPLLKGSIDAEACTSPQPDSCTMVQRWANQCGDGIYESNKDAPPPANLRWTFEQLVAPLVPIATVPMPEIPACVRKLAGEPGDFAILELTRYPQNSYRAYFQTAHGKALVGWPIRDNDGDLRVRGMTPFAHVQGAFLRGTLEALPDGQALSEHNVRYVALYQGERQSHCLLRIPQRAPQMERLPNGRRPARHTDTGLTQAGPGHAREPQWFTREDFIELYGEPVCEDEMITLFATGTGGTP